MENVIMKDLFAAANTVKMYGNAFEKVEKIVIDSRKAGKDTLFVAIKGENFDGHDFIEECYKNGCRLFMVNKDSNVSIKDDMIVLFVEDTELGLGLIANMYKERYKIPYVGVTGSVGKTTTRDMIHAALAGRFNSHKNVGNLNNHLGVPLTLFELNKDHECAVLEMGMSHFGEIEYLANMLNPDVAVISNIGLSHVENLGSIEGVLKAKMEITKNFNKRNLLVINGDDEMLAPLKEQALEYRIKTFGFNENNDLYCKSYELLQDHIKFVCKINGVDETFEVPAIGEHNVLNALSAILVSLEYGLTVDEIRIGLSKYVPTGMRLDIVETDKITIINDCYNASPTSMKASLKVLKNLKEGNRGIAVLGDIYEMGEMSELGHREVGEASVNCADLLLTVGVDSKYIYDEAMVRGIGKGNAYHFEGKKQLITFLSGVLEKDDVVLIKASRGMKLEEVVNAIK